MSTRMSIGNQPIVLDNLIHNYDFTDYTSGTTITNMVNSAQSASLDNSPTHNKLGYIELDGTNDSLEITPTDIGLGDSGPTCTMEMGFRIPTGTSNELFLLTANTSEVAISSDGTGHSHTYTVCRNSSGKLKLITRAGSSHTNWYGSHAADKSTLDVENNVWYHMSIRVSADGSSFGGGSDGLVSHINLNNVNFINRGGMYGGVAGPHRHIGAGSNIILGASAPSTASRTTYPLEIAYFRAYTVKQTDAQRTQNYNHHVGRFSNQRY